MAVGTQFLPKAVDYARRLREGTPVALVPEPSNPHDPDAIRVVVDGFTLGYVPNRGHSCARCWGSVDKRLLVCRECGSDEVVEGGLATRIKGSKLLDGHWAAIVESVDDASESAPLRILLATSLQTP